MNDAPMSPLESSPEEHRKAFQLFLILAAVAIGAWLLKSWWK